MSLPRGYLRGNAGSMMPYILAFFTVVASSSNLSTLFRVAKLIYKGRTAKFI